MTKAWEPGYVARPWATLTDNWRKLEAKATPAFQTKEPRQ